jgi:succinate-semialdehyde dehydrogenase/glutarate-semialdehyde dehydrogenase
MTPEMRVANEETFGPVAPLFRFKTEDEALALANGTPFGLAAYFYTENIRRSWRVAERLECGMVGLNTGSVSIEAAPFGGVKQSGFGREGSKYGMDEYLQIKSFHIGEIA